MEAKNDKLYAMRHSLAHILAAAILETFPDAKFGVGPVIDNGFFYDFELPRQLTPEDLPALEKKMRSIVNKKHDFVRSEMPIDDAIKRFADLKQEYKVELLNDLKTKGTTAVDKETQEAAGVTDMAGTVKDVSLYTTGAFVDLCRGPHVESTSEIPADSFKLDRVAGAYWRGSEKNKQLQRVYGLAFTSKQELRAYVEMRIQAQARDHKKLGKELDLFTFSDLVGGGLPLWTPRGTIIRDQLDAFVWQLRKARGYVRVDIPHITKKELYETSGHWNKFKDELFKIKTREDHLFVMKPMNCPHHTQIYNRKAWSYRELPQRYAETTKVYRDEQTGELSGLSRVRSITQDDAHVFCRQAQVKEEILKIWDIITEFYAAGSFSLTPRLSLHDPKHPEKYLGTPEVWETAENALREIVKEKGMAAEEALGEAAFYGPKIDFMGKDSLGRPHQVATVQLDMNMPERFDLTCLNEKGEKERIVMIHAAIMGSIERYLAVLIEHFAGAFPLWLAPEQVRIIPISDKFNDYAATVAQQLNGNDIRVQVDGDAQTMGKKIREAEKLKVPYMLIVGAKEQEAGKVSVRGRGKGDEGQTDLALFIERIATEIKDKKV